MPGGLMPPRGDATWWGDACPSLGACRELVLGALPHLLQLDTQPVRGSMDEEGEEEEEEEEGGSSSSEDEDDESLSEPSHPFTAGKGAQPSPAGHGARLVVKQAGPRPQG